MDERKDKSRLSAEEIESLRIFLGSKDPYVDRMVNTLCDMAYRAVLLEWQMRDLWRLERQKAECIETIDTRTQVIRSMLGDE